jgi:hypothetical protein
MPILVNFIVGLISQDVGYPVPLSLLWRYWRCARNILKSHSESPQTKKGRSRRTGQLSF